MRLLFLASYFPRPGKPLMGTWALEQAKALAERCELLVASPSYYVPRVMGVFPRARAWGRAPSFHQFDRVTVKYVPGLYYPVFPVKGPMFRRPGLPMGVAWGSIRRRLLGVVEEFRPAVVFAHHSAVNGYFAWRLKRETGLPYVVADHDFEEIRACERLAARKAFVAPIVREASASVCVCRRMEEDLRRSFPFARAVTLANGVTPPGDAATDVPLRRRADQTVILSVGMFAERKGFPLLVRAFAKVAGRFPEAVLRIVGDGPERRRIERTIGELRLGGRVELAGALPPEQVFREMASADLFALVGWDEPFGVVYLEAMSCGLPVIAAGDCGIRDVVQEGEQGLFVPPGDVEAAACALARLLERPALRRGMGASGRRLVRERLTWGAHCEKLLPLLEAARISRGAEPAVTLAGDGIR